VFFERGVTDGRIQLRVELASHSEGFSVGNEEVHGGGPFSRIHSKRERTPPRPTPSYKLTSEGRLHHPRGGASSSSAMCILSWTLDRRRSPPSILHGLPRLGWALTLKRPGYFEFEYGVVLSLKGRLLQPLSFNLRKPTLSSSNVMESLNHVLRCSII
jgi:hypothetical protein